MKYKFLINPLEHGMATETPSLHTPALWSPFAQNIRLDQHSLVKRPGYSNDQLYTGANANRNLGTNVTVYAIVLFQTSGASHNRSTLYLTGSDLCEKEIGTAKTFSYKTPTYTTGTGVTIADPYTTVEGTGAMLWLTNVAKGDQFIVTEDHTTNVEPDGNWRTVYSITDDDTLVLSLSYGAAKTTKPYKIRKLYSVPPDERWSWAFLGDKFYFTNGNVDVQVYTGSGNASALNGTYAKQARYCIEYANRLFLADLIGGSGVRDAYLVQWSKENDPSDWTDSTAGSAAMLETEDFITGLGKSGASLVVYKRDNLIFYSRSGEATSPITKVGEAKGIGCIAPYGIIEVLGSSVFPGKDDFYFIDGNQPRGLSREKIRFKFFDIVEPTEQEKTWGFVDGLRNEVQWIANTTSGKYAFVWNYISDEWTIYNYAADVVGAGKGAL